MSYVLLFLSFMCSPFYIIFVVIRRLRHSIRRPISRLISTNLTREFLNVSVSISFLRECSVAVIARVGALLIVCKQVILYIWHLRELLLAQVAGESLDLSPCGGIKNLVRVPLFFFANLNWCCLFTGSGRAIQFMIYMITITTAFDRRVCSRNWSNWAFSNLLKIDVCTQNGVV